MEVPNQISAIARMIRQDWKNVYFGARPYLQAMSAINTINDMYGEDSADSIIRYFLGNAGTWKGETARAVKTKLKRLLND